MFHGSFTNGVVPRERALETFLEGETRAKPELVTNFPGRKVNIPPLDANAIHRQQWGGFDAK